MYNIHPDNTYRVDLKNIGYLDNYTELFATRFSSSRESLSKAYYQNKNNAAVDTVLIEQLGNVVDKSATAIKESVKSILSTVRREAQFAATFGAPFSYLEAVDPFGRVYKDLFGIRREETWTNNVESLMTDNNDSKTFAAFIKVGMISQAKGSGIIQRLINSKDKTKDIEPPSRDQIRKNLAKTKKVTESSITPEEIDNFLINKGFMTANSSIITSFSMSYVINEDSLGSNEKYWRKGSAAPFNMFLLNAIERGFILTDQAISASSYGGSSSSSSAIFAENRSSLKQKIHRILRGNSLPFFKKGLLDKGSEVSREISFISGGGDSVSIIQQILDSLGNVGKESDSMLGSLTETLSNTTSSILSGAQSGLNAIFGKDMVDMILKGNSLIYPRVWKSSSIEKMCSLQMRFYSPYGDFESIYMNVLFPLFVILGFSLPRQVYPSFLSFPFCFSVEIPGLYQSNMAMVTNIAIKRGGRYDAWNDASMMRGVDITLDVTALKPMYGFPEEGMSANFTLGSEIYGDGSISSDGGRKGDITFSNEILNYMGSFIVTDQDISDQINVAVSDTLNTFENCKNVNLLKFDFYLPLYNTLIEIDGKQHYDKNSMFFDEKIANRDYIKNKFCIDNNLKLIRIRYNIINKKFKNECTSIINNLKGSTTIP